MTVVLLMLLACAWTYLLLSMAAAWRYAEARPAKQESHQPISVLKPLAGLESGLEANLRTFFEQDYPEFEILFAVGDTDDPAIAVVEKLRSQYGHVPVRLLVTGEPPYSNAKVYSLERLLDAAAHDLVVMSDSDTSVTPDMLRTVDAEFHDSSIGLATCPYRAVAGPSFWSRLEATGMNTNFMAGILVARMIEGMRFALGPTIVARQLVLDSIGGIQRLKDYLAEDFLVGKFAAGAGYQVLLSSYVIEHHIGSSDLKRNAAHRLRWVRSTRRSRPVGYIGQLLTMPLPLALLACAFHPTWWPLLSITVVLRCMSAYLVSERVLRAQVSWWLLPMEDLLEFGFWLAGFFGNTVESRGRRYRLYRDGRFELLPSFGTQTSCKSGRSS
jgi:ceramide glucosyltransferase